MPRLAILWRPNPTASSGPTRHLRSLAQRRSAEPPDTGVAVFFPARPVDPTKSSPSAVFHGECPVRPPESADGGRSPATGVNSVTFRAGRTPRRISGNGRAMMQPCFTRKCRLGDRLDWGQVASRIGGGPGRGGGVGADNVQAPAWLPSCPFELFLQSVSPARLLIDALHEFFGRFFSFFPLGLDPGHDRLLP